jgi:hypothetical protein
MPSKEDEIRARILADLEQGRVKRVRTDGGWLYPPVPIKDLPPEPPMSIVALALLGAVVAVVVASLALCSHRRRSSRRASA